VKDKIYVYIVSVHKLQYMLLGTELVSYSIYVQYCVVQLDLIFHNCLSPYD